MKPLQETSWNFVSNQSFHQLSVGTMIDLAIYWSFVKRCPCPPSFEDSLWKGSGTLMTMLYKKNIKMWDTYIWVLTFSFLRGYKIAFSGPICLIYMTVWGKDVGNHSTCPRYALPMFTLLWKLSQILSTWCYEKAINHKSQVLYHVTENICTLIEIAWLE